MQHRLPDLPWPTDALAPQMSARTLELHHGKHHASYVAKLNGLIKDTEFADLPLEDLVLRAEGAIFNNAAQHWNHSFFWQSLRPAGGEDPEGELLEALKAGFDSLAGFRKKFSEAAVNNFGSGWTWLAVDQRGGLEIVNTGNAGNPLRDGKTPLLTCDVWEHAYYVDYQNRRPDYLAAFWDVVNWEHVAQRYLSAGRQPARKLSAGKAERSTRA
jgi:Fe-Mn family superoxide dismutase